MFRPNLDYSTLLRYLFSLLLLAQIPSEISAQEVNQTVSQATLANAIEEAPIIDGEVLGEELWQQIQPVGELTQQQPNFGEAPTEKTEVRIAYTPKVFYVSVICYDSEPEKLVVSDARRDASLENTDAFLLLIDTYHDGQNGFIFGTGTNGLEYDAQVTNEGQGNFSQNRQQRGVIGGFNLNWDASWEVKTQVGEFGWSAEFAIPFRTIRFNSGKNQTWGLNFRRNIRKNNQIAYWAPIPFMLDLNRISLAGDLNGLNLQNPGNLKAIPYVLGQATRDLGSNSEETDWKLRPDVGGDIKYSVTPSLTLDLTINTDFAQVEVDDQQINLDRFNLFFPEKRPFFLENAGQFTMGSPGEVDLFFSRRIGLDNNRQVVPIIGGGRLSGKINKTNVGFLSMFTEETGSLADSSLSPANNFSVVRVNHEFAARSAIGAGFVSRQGMSGLEDDFNRTYAVDGRWGLGKKAQLTGFYARTQSPGDNQGAHSYRFQAGYNWDGWILNGAVTEVGEAFNPEVGFLLRESFRKFEALVFKNIRAKSGNKFRFLENRPHVSYRGYWGLDGFHQTGFLHVDNHWVWKSGFEIHTGINFTREGLQQPFEIFPGVTVEPGTYDHSEAQLVMFTNGSKPVSFRYFGIYGGQFGGSRALSSFTLGLRAGNKFNSEFNYSRNDFNLPGGKFNADIFRARLSYNFTPLIFLQGLIQYNGRDDIWATNIRFGVLQQSNTGLFVVLNDIRGNDAFNNRSITIKYSRLFDVVK